MSLVLKVKNHWTAVGDVQGSIVVQNGPGSIERGTVQFPAVPQGEVAANTSEPFLIRVGDISGMTPVELLLTLHVGGFSQEIPLRIFFGVRRVTNQTQPPFDSLTTIGVPPVKPALSGHRLVWTDARNGSLDIFYYNFATGQEFLLTPDLTGEAIGQPQLQGRPSISGDLVAWEDQRNGISEIFYLRLSDGLGARRVPVPQGLEDRYHLQPSISGDYITWTASTTSPKVLQDADIVMFNTRTQQLTRLTDTPKAQLNSDISGQSAIYEDASISGVVYVPNVNDPLTQVPVTPFLTFPLEPRIGQGRVVFPALSLFGGMNLYTSRPVGASELSLEKITDDSFFQTLPDVHGDHVVWQDDRNNNWDIYYQNLATGNRARLSNFSSIAHQYPAISESYVAWVSRGVVWATQVPGASPPEQEDDEDSPQSTVQVQAKVSYNKKSKSLNLDLSSHYVATGQPVQNQGDSCEFAIYAGKNKKALGQPVANLTTDRASLNIQLTKMPALRKVKSSTSKGDRRKAKKQRVLIKFSVSCLSGLSGESEDLRVRATKRKRGSVKAKRWLKSFRKKIQSAGVQGS